MPPLDRSFYTVRMLTWRWILLGEARRLQLLEPREGLDEFGHAASSTWQQQLLPARSKVYSLGSNCRHGCCDVILGTRHPGPYNERMGENKQPRRVKNAGRAVPVRQRAHTREAATRKSEAASSAALAPRCKVACGVSITLSCRCLNGSTAATGGVCNMAVSFEGRRRIRHRIRHRQRRGRRHRRRRLDGSPLRRRVPYTTSKTRMQYSIYYILSIEDYTHTTTSWLVSLSRLIRLFRSGQQAAANTTTQQPWGVEARRPRIQCVKAAMPMPLRARAAQCTP